MTWWRLYVHCLFRGHRMCVAQLEEGGYHYFCECGYYNEWQTLTAVLAELKERGEVRFDIDGSN